MPPARGALRVHTNCGRFRRRTYLLLSGPVVPEPGKHDRVGALADDLDGTFAGPDDDAHALPVTRKAQHMEHLRSDRLRKLVVGAVQLQRLIQTAVGDNLLDASCARW